MQATSNRQEKAASTRKASQPARGAVSARDVRHFWYMLLSSAVLLLMFALALASMVQKAPTYDEQGYILRGLAALRGHTQIRIGHPLGLNAMNAALLAADETVALPLDDASWSGTSFHRPAELFLWEIGNDVEHIMFLARLPSLWIGMLMAAIASRWAGQLSRRRWTSLLALLFVALDPNILAHTRLTTTDLGLAAFALLAAYTLWLFLRQPALSRVLVAGAALGLLQNTKFTALLFVPLFGLLILVWLAQQWRLNRVRDQTSIGKALPWRELSLILIVYPLVALLTLWGTYGFDVGVLPGELPAMQFLSGTTWPLAGHLEQLLDIGGRMRVSTPAFLLGQYSDSGWWYYFPVAFLVKTPLPTLILFGWGIAAYVYCILRHRKFCPSFLDSTALLIPAVGYFAIAVTTDINLGYRHLLPVLPFLVVFSTTAVSRSLRPETARKLILPLSLSAWLVLITLLIYPDYLTFFNSIAGGPDRGWQSLADSNIDWGQDLDDLAPWMALNGVEQVWLSYFGEARPDHYGINYQGLDSFPPRLMNPQARPFYASDPAPGTYAISATNLQGVHFADHNQFAWFRELTPIDKLGGSIFLYEVKAYGAPAGLVLAGLQMDQLPPAAFARLGTNDVTPRWVDPQQALIVPAGDNAWLARPSAGAIHPQLDRFLRSSLQDISQDDDTTMARYNAQPFQSEELARFSLDDGRVHLNKVEVQSGSGSDISIATAWQQDGPPQQLQIFIHALDENDQIVAQWDGLGAAWEGWRQGDMLLQMHELSLPEVMNRRPSALLIGLYDPVSGERWLTEKNADHYTVQLGIE